MSNEIKTNDKKGQIKLLKLIVYYVIKVLRGGKLHRCLKSKEALHSEMNWATRKWPIEMSAATVISIINDLCPGWTRSI